MYADEEFDDELEDLYFLDEMEKEDNKIGEK